MAKSVWIDLENSPHVPFFLPWIAWLRERGHEVLLTARDLSQTHELLRLHDLSFAELGGHGGGSGVSRGWRTARRSVDLARWARGRRIGLALGHGSRGQALAAALLGVPGLTFVDYEYVSLRLFGICSRRVLVPESVPAEVLRRAGISDSKRVAYPGFKEQVYIDSQVHRPEPECPPLILLRPPARRAHYHTRRSDDLYLRLLDRLAREASRCRVRILPRYDSDAEELRPWLDRYPHFSLPDRAVVGVDLVRRASLVASGGGTMIREAAVIGVPAVSFFGGPVGGVDRALSALGRLRLLRIPEDVDRLELPAPASTASPESSGSAGPDGSRDGLPGVAASELPDARRVRAVLQEEVARWL